MTLKDVRLQVGDNRTLDINMQIAGGYAPRSRSKPRLPQLDRESAAIGNVIGSQQVREIPLNGRSWASLMLLAPGAVNTGAGDMGSIRFSGRSNDDNNFMYDGVDASGVKDQTMEAELRLVVSTDSIAEFRVNSSLYSAESGSGGGAQINLVSKGGTNEFHGGLFEFVRNERLRRPQPVRYVEAAVPAQPVRRQPGRTDHQEPDVLLRQLRRLAAAAFPDHARGRSQRGV